jgi:O-antigen ligase
MLLTILTLFSIWLIPSLKIYGGISFWHVFLMMTLFFTYITRNKLDSFLKVAKANSIFLLILLLFPLFASIRDLFGGNLSTVLSSYILRGVGGLLFSLCLATYFNSEKNKRLFIILLGAILVCHASIGILQIVKPDIFFKLPVKLAQQAGVPFDRASGRVSGLFINQHIFGQHMLGLVSIFLPGLFFATQKTKISPSLKFFSLTTPLGIVAILASYARGAYIGMIIITLLLAYFIVIYKKFSKRVFIISITLLIFIFITAVSLNIFEQREATRLTEFGGRIDSKRISAYESAFIRFQNNPFFGIGGGTEIGETAIHNIILKAFTFYGIFGGLIYLFFYFSLFLKIMTIPKKYLTYKIGLFLWLATYLFYGMGHTAGFWMAGLIEWTFIGLMLSLVEPNNEMKSNDESRYKRDILIPAKS